jgi:hypothetical protein
MSNRIQIRPLGSWSVIQDYNSTDPDPEEIFTYPQHWRQLKKVVDQYFLLSKQLAPTSPPPSASTDTMATFLSSLCAGSGCAFIS